MAHPAPDPVKLLASWMEWERGDLMPGKVMSNLKTGGLRILLEAIVEQLPPPEPAPPVGGEDAGAEAEEAWTPVV